MADTGLAKLTQSKTKMVRTIMLESLFDFSDLIFLPENHFSQFHSKALRLFCFSLI